MRHPHDVLQMVGMQRSELDQMHEMFLGLPLAADEEHVSCLMIFTDGSASLDAVWPRRRTAAGRVPSSCKESQELNKGSLASWVVR